MEAVMHGLIQTVVYVVLILAAAFIGFILTDKAGQEPPIPMVIKLVILIIALLAIAHLFGVA